jgi:biotin carboxylase
MGVKTIVTSNVPDDAAKKIAWKAANVNGLDVPGLVSLAREEQVDGVLVGVADILVPAYCKVCDALNLPCYATQQIVDTFNYKDVFKATCESFGVHGIPEYYLDADLKAEDVGKMHFPVMVKPVDGYSGLGMTVCEKADELNTAVNKALSFSKCKRFIVERYMGGCEDVGIYYTFKDGVCSLSCIFDRYTTNEQEGLSRVNLGSIYPSKHIEDYFRRMHKNALRMFESIGIRNGVLLLSGFYENGEFYMYDPGFRFQGEAPHLLMKAVNGFDQREMLIRFALTGFEGDVDLASEDDVYFKGKSAATLWFLLRKGTIAMISGLENVAADSRIIANVQRLYVGDIVKPEWIGTEKQVMTRLYIVCDTKDELRKCIDEYRDKVKVLDTDGNCMTLAGFDTSII